MTADTTASAESQADPNSSGGGLRKLLMAAGMALLVYLVARRGDSADTSPRPTAERAGAVQTPDEGATDRTTGETGSSHDETETGDDTHGDADPDARE